MYIIWGIVVVLSYKFISNGIKYFQVKRHLKRYQMWLRNINVDFSIVEDKATIKKLILGAGVNDAKVDYVEPLGYWHVSTGFASTLENFPSNLERMAPHMIRMFEEALGVYKTRCFETFNPMYWIEFVIYLPKNFLVYLGVNSENIGVKLIQIVWWFITVSLAALFPLYKDQIKLFIDKFVEQLFK
ncbi:hypothetical protein J27TS7_57660 [Paenibacillus dendritiformis]|uniref:hypothetical protein n=1 Tax=Paenibacillus dendritiformis TaxID=130049 RepID=UPI001B021F67|nr:hypothetical protein [Paenibacillus dendritiformis]GIO76252.1 hypothetical protein J27TS7_57660 [Paenibacillus dendritiformis]